MSQSSPSATHCDRAWAFRHRALRPWARWFSFALLLLAPALATLFRPAAVWAEEKPAVKADRANKAAVDPALDNEPAEYLRFVDDNHGGGKLQVAVGTYKNDNGVTVHLVGAVHVGEKQYYEGLNKEFEKYDALLYEMVKPANMGAPVKGAKPQSMISMFQHFLKDVLELDFQLDDIDYTKKNFVHADLDAETFEKMQQERGESMLGLMLSQMMRQMAKQMEGAEQGKAQPEMSLMDLIDAFNSPDRGRQLKLLMGRSFGDVEEQMSGMEGTVLVTERNKKALSVLKDEIKSGKKNLGIFYGAAHMHDMESRLALMGFKRTGIEWRTAWDMTVKNANGNNGNAGRGAADREEKEEKIEKQ